MTKSIQQTPGETVGVTIGKAIEDECRRQERTVAWLARKIHTDRRNVYDIFKRSSIDTELLLRLSVALHKDFFKLYQAKLEEEFRKTDESGGVIYWTEV